LIDDPLFVPTTKWLTAPGRNPRVYEMDDTVRCASARTIRPSMHHVFQWLLPHIESTKEESGSC